MRILAKKVERLFDSCGKKSCLNRRGYSMKVKYFKLLASILLLVLLGGCDFIDDTPHPSDNDLIEIFQKNEADFEKLIQMAKEDSEFVRIAPDFTWHKDNASVPRDVLNLPSERFDEYRKLFRKLELKAGIINSQPKDVWFVSSAKGLVTGGSSKGFMFLTEEPFPLVESLDEPDWNRPELKGRKSKILYRKLKDNWYLYYLID